MSSPPTRCWPTSRFWRLTNPKAAHPVAKANSSRPNTSPISSDSSELIGDVFGRELFAFATGCAAFEFVRRQNLDVGQQRVGGDDIERGFKFLGGVVFGEERRSEEE